MNATRRLSIAALAVACLHLVFGAIVRITGSGMGCGDHWPKCYGHWFPPFNRPDLIVEVSHRYLASILTLTVLSMALVAWRHRRVAGIGGKGGAMRSAFGALAAVLSAAILGGVTVKMGNAPWATVAHWLVAMALLAMVATTSIRCGALGGASSLVQRGSQRARRSGLAAAFLAILAVALGGLTAKYPGAAVGCTTVPLCGPNPNVEAASVHVQLTHRTLAVLLVLHLIGVVMMVRKRRAEEAPVVIRAAYVALGMVLLQLVVASAMVLFHLPPVLRSLHEATGVGIWLSCFTLAYLARRASNVTPPEPATLPDPSPKGGISIVREPVAAPSVIAASETIVASAPVAEAAVVEDVAVIEEIPDAEEVAIVAEAVAVAEVAVAEVAVAPEPEPVVLSEAKDPSASEEIVDITELLEEESAFSLATHPQDDETLEEVAAADDGADGAAIVAELILAIEDAAKEAALERAEVLAREAALAVILSEAQSPAAVEEVVEEERDPSVAPLPQDDAIESALPLDAAVESALPQDDTIEAAPLQIAAVEAELPHDDTLLEELDWEPRRAESEELDEFSIAALEAEVAALEAAHVEDVQPALVEATVIEPEPVVELEPVVALEPVVVAEAVVVEAPIPAEPADQITADASIVVPPVKAPKLSPLTAPTMAVLVARGADFL